jgi:hypothetical protein
MTKNSMHYSGITPEDDINGELSTVTEIGPTLSSSSPQAGFHALERYKKVSACMAFSIIAAVFIFVFIVIGTSSKASISNRGIIARSDGFDEKSLLPFRVNGPEYESAVIGSSSYPAVLLYRYDKSDKIFGHIPHGLVDTEEPFLMVDQITTGVGERCRTKKPDLLVII